MGIYQYSGILCFCLLVLKTCSVGSQRIGYIYPGFEASTSEWNEKDFLLSNNSVFGLGFYRSRNITQRLLLLRHISSGKGLWTANRALLVDDSDKFVFDQNGNVSMKMGNDVVWSPDTSGEKVASMELRDTGNLVLLAGNGTILWQSFSFPTDTLLPGQNFSEGMSLASAPNKDRLRFYLEFKSGDLVLYAGYRNPQTYWSLANDSRKTNNSVSGKAHSASLEADAWNFYDQNNKLLWQFLFSENADGNGTWALMLGTDGLITFSLLQNGDAVTRKKAVIPQNSCGTPQPCDPYYFCELESFCKCPEPLQSQFNCKPPIASTCNNSSNDSVELFYIGASLDYFALNFVTPFPVYDLDACKEACLHNCSCTVLFFENSTKSCFLFDQIGSLQHSQQDSGGYVSYMKISRGNGDKRRNGGKMAIVIVVIVVASISVIAGLLYAGLWYHRKKRSMNFSQEDLEEDCLLDNLPGMPARFNYNELSRATKSFSTKIGQGGFGSVYLGELPDSIKLAVKKLEAIGQGKKEFRAEVSTIGKVHHLHLAKLRGFCAEGAHRLLVYEYMGNGSLDKWIFMTDEESQLLSWNTRFNIALGTAKGLAYLHSECEVKIVHCDIKPENILLDDNFTAKVADFGLAKLMTHEESRAYTTLRGTRGYLAPEWIRNNPISEKSDVYGYGMVLLEIIGGRRCYDPDQDDSKKAHLPSYAFKMLEEGKLREIIDPKLEIKEDDETVLTAIKVALWCIQEEMHLRPPMTTVVQMLKGSCNVPLPPATSMLSSQANTSFIKWSNEEDSPSTLLGDNNGGVLSVIQLSGPR